MDAAAPGTGQHLAYDGTKLVWVAPPIDDPAVGGDLSGTASNAQIVAGAVGSTELATGAVLVDSIGSSNAAGTDQLLSYDGSALTWVDPESGGTIAAVIDCYTYTFGETIGATGTARMYVEYASTVSKIRLSAGTAIAGQSVIVDINKNGTTLYTTQANRPTLAVGASTQVAAAPDVTAFAAGDYITVDVDQLGSTAGSYGVPLTISIYLQRN